MNDTTLIDELSAHHVEFSGSQPSGFASFLVSLLAWLLPVRLLIGFWIWFIRRTGAGGLDAGLSLVRWQHKLFDRAACARASRTWPALEEAVEKFVRQERHHERSWAHALHERMHGGPRQPSA